MASFSGWLRVGVGAVVLAGVWAGAQQPVVLVEPPTPLLQAQVGPWVLGDASAGGAGDLAHAGFAGASCLIEVKPSGAQGGEGCAGLLKEDGLQRFASGEYRQGNLLRAVHALQFVDATGAFSAFTFYRSRLVQAQRPVVDYKAARGSVSSGKETLLWAGNVVLLSEQALTKAEMDEVVVGLPKVGGGKGMAPLLPSLLPAEGLDAASVRYALGPTAYGGMGGVLPAEILGWDKSAEGVTAGYRGGRGTLTLLMYPTPQIAGDRGRAIEKSVADAGGPAKFGTLRMRRVGPMIGVASGGFTPKQADALIAGLRLNQEVTFDKKKPLEFHAEVRKTASLLQNIAVLSGVLILAAVLLGLFLGFGRAGIRKLQGKPAYIEPEFLSISLRDEPKALFGGKNEKG